MARPLRWADQSLDDIDAIAEYIGRDSPVHARRIVAALFELGDQIAAMPHAGRIVPEFGSSTLRERFLYSYRVLYEIGADDIVVLAVVHGRRLIAPETG